MYRAQRPVWGYLAWAASLGQANLAGGPSSCWRSSPAGSRAVSSRCCSCNDGASPWWALLTLAVGYESIGTLTPELFALALFGTGILLWNRDRRRMGDRGPVRRGVDARDDARSASPRSRCGSSRRWLTCRRRGGARGRLVRRSLPKRPSVRGARRRGRGMGRVRLAVRLGSWPTGSSESRLTMPGFGLLDSIANRLSPGLVLGALAALALCVASVALARRDPLSWISSATGSSPPRSARRSGCTPDSPVRSSRSTCSDPSWSSVRSRVGGQKAGQQRQPAPRHRHPASSSPHRDRGRARWSPGTPSA